MIQRGIITLWFSEDVIEKWHPCDQKEKGNPQIYSHDAILCALFIKSVYHLPIRDLEGFLLSLIALLKFLLQVSSYTQICRRARNLAEAS